MGGKGYKRTYRRGARDKYSVEQTIFNASVSNVTTSVIQVVPPSDTQGMRKVKHLTISAVPAGSSTTGFIWVLFYLPAGMAPPGFSTVSGSSLVEPNQFVMNCGTFDHDAGPVRIRSPVSRNLNSGDQIVLLIRAVSDNASASNSITGLVRYAITLQ